MVVFSTVSLPIGSELKLVTFRLENKNQIWDDTLMMTGSFGRRLKLISVIPLAKIGLFLNRPQYIEEGNSPRLIKLRHSKVPVSSPHPIPHGSGHRSLDSRMGVRR